VFEMLREFLTHFRFKHHYMPTEMPIEGIVWHRPDGRMVKCLASDLGVPWKAKDRRNGAGTVKAAA